VSVSRNGALRSPSIPQPGLMLWHAQAVDPKGQSRFVGWPSRRRNRRRLAASFISVALLPRERMAAMTCERFFFVKTSGTTKP
jgi:hypothetical protein